ncbi:TPA: DUF3289 family protein [Photobacterium damselae]
MNHEKTPCPSPTCPICSRLKPEPRKLSLKERIIKQREENLKASDRVWEHVKKCLINGDFDFIHPPVQIFHTRRKMDDYNADDLNSGDMKQSEIKKLSPFFGLFDSSFNRDPDSLFDDFRDRARGFAQGSYQDVIVDLITHMQNNSGSKYESNKLTSAMKNHESTREFSHDISKLIFKELKGNAGKLTATSLIRIQSNIMKNSSLPKFSAIADMFNGLALSIHDVYAVKVVLSELTIEGKKFSGVLEYQVQDHFGLDQPDVGLSKPFHPIAMFRDWFILQRYNKFGYKPFVTEMNFAYPIEGTF